MGLAEIVQGVTTEKLLGGQFVTYGTVPEEKLVTEDGGNGENTIEVSTDSLTDDQKKLGAPKDFEVTVRNLKIAAGAGFIVALTGDIMTMPGLPKVPAAEKIDISEDGVISGLF